MCNRDEKVEADLSQHDIRISCFQGRSMGGLWSA